MPNWDQIRCVHWFGSPHCEALPLVALQQGHRNWQAWAGIRNTLKTTTESAPHVEAHK